MTRTCRRLEAVLMAAAVSITAMAAWGQAKGPAPAQAPAAPVIPGIMAEDKPIKVVTTVDKSVIRVGDLVHYSMSIQSPPGYKVAMPAPGAQLGMFLIRDYSFPGLEKEKQGLMEKITGWVENLTGSRLGNTTPKQEFNFTITTYETGDLLIPPVPLVVESASGDKHLLYAESARVRVVPVTNPEDLTVRDIKAPIEIKIPKRTWLPWAAAPVVAIAAIAALILFLRGRGKEEPEIVDLRPAHVIALEELDALEALGLLGSGEYEKYYTAVSRTIRKYISLRFSMYALEYTTTEILHRLKSEDMARSDYELTCGLLEETDRVKFARYEPTLEERSSIMERSRSLVMNTREPEPVEEREAA